MSSVAETSRVKDDSDKSLSRRRGLRLVACLVENKAEKLLVENRPDRQFNIEISDDMFSDSDGNRPGQGAGDSLATDLNLGSSTEADSHHCIETPSIVAPARIAFTLLAGGILGYLIGSKRK